MQRGADERGKLVKNFTMSNDCLCEIIHKRSLYDAWQLCEIIHNLGNRGVCLPVPEVDMAVSLSLSDVSVCGARAWLRAFEVNPKLAFDILICN